MFNLNFLKFKSWDEIVEMVVEVVKKVQFGEWIIGRGWYQEKWLEVLDCDVLGYFFYDKLSVVLFDNLVLLGYVSGYGLFVNVKVMELVGVIKEMLNFSGGEIVRDFRGEVIGVFEERV